MAPPKSSDYVVLSHIEHIRLRPDTYVGSVRPEVRNSYCISDEGPSRLVQKELPDYVPGLYKIFDEVLVNSIDQAKTDPALTTIKVTCNTETGRICIQNDGHGIPVEKHPQLRDLYTPEVIFGVLLSGTNYDDKEERLTGGRNGLGVKLINVFSSELAVEVIDPEGHLKFTQRWSDGMKRRGEPKVTRLSDAGTTTGSVKVSFVPNYASVGLRGLSDGCLGLERAVDAAACTPDRVKVVFGGKRISVKRFSEYVSFYVESSTPRVEYKDPKERWRVCFTRSDDDLGVFE
jgi:DNA topoisomerase-2